MDHSSALEYSSLPPVSVYGTDCNNLALEVFLGSMIRTNPIVRRLKVLSYFSTMGGFAYPMYTYVLYRTIPSVRRSFTSSLPHRNYYKYWNINQFTIGFPFRVILRIRLTLI
jgi:hypothetical protein